MTMQETVRILVVDDEPIIREGLERYFDWNKLGAKPVGFFETAAAALGYLREQEADILVTDINMAGMTGITLAEEVQKQGKPIRVVFITAYMEFEYAYKAVKNSFVDDFVLKPIDPAELERALMKSIARVREQRLVRVPALSEQDNAFYGDQRFARLKKQATEAVKNAKPDEVKRAVMEGLELARHAENPDTLAARYIFDLLTQCTDMMELDDMSVKQRPDIQELTQMLLQNESFSIIQKKAVCVFCALAESVMVYLENKFSVISIRAVEIIEREFISPSFSLQSLADELGVSSNYISTKLKKEIGIGFTRYLTNIRIEKAKELLSHTDKKVFEICRYVGIEDVRYFTRVFKEYVGITPIEFRNLSGVKRIVCAADTWTDEAAEM